MLKRGQLSLFIIIGVLMLAATATVIYFQSSSQGGDEIDIVEAQKFTSDDQKKIHAYVSSCLKMAAADGLQIMSLQGGYIDIPSSVEVQSVKNNDGLTVFDDNGIKRIKVDNGLNEVPFWVTKTGISIPSKELMQIQLSDYVNQRVKVCAGDFAGFKQEGYEVYSGDISSDVQIGSSVVFDVLFPVTLKKGEQESSVDSYKVSVPINIDKILDVSEQLTLYEINNPYLEHHTMKLVGLFSGVNENKIPPTYASRVDLSCDYVTWSKSAVKARLKSILQSNIPALKVAGTDFVPIVVSGSGVYDGMIMDILDGEYDDVKVDLSYRPEFDLNLNVLPSRGDMIKPSSFSQGGIPMVSLLCVNTYRFKYYIDYPVLFDVTDESSAGILNGKVLSDKGYSFDYLMDVYVVGNQPRQFVPLSMENSPIDVEGVLDFAEDSGVDVIYNDKFCDEKHMLSQEYTFEVGDDSSYDDISDVAVKYACGSIENDCVVGRTGDSGTLTTKLPLCDNGLLIFSKRGDYEDVIQRFTSLGDDVPEPVLMTKLRELDVNLKLVDVKDIIFAEKNGLEFKDYAFDMEEKDFAVLNVPGTINSMVMVPSDQKLKIAKNTYLVNIDVTGRAELVLPDNVDIDIGEISMGPIGNTKFTWTPVIDGDSKVVFYAVVNRDLSNVDMIDANGNIKARVIYDAVGEISSIVADNDIDYAVPVGGHIEVVSIAKDEYISKLLPEVE